jgi:CBS domain-containing protein
MTRPVIAFSPETGLQTLARVFLRTHISGAPVVDPDGKPLGIVTKTDLIDPERLRGAALPGNDVYYKLGEKIEALRDGGVPGQGRAGELMSPFSVSTTPTATLEDAMKLMVADDIHRLLVIEDGHIIGILTAMGAMRAVVK